MPVSSAVYLCLVLSVITVPVAREWPLSITSTFRKIGPHQLSKIKNATLMVNLWLTNSYTVLKEEFNCAFDVRTPTRFFRSYSFQTLLVVFFFF